MRIAVASDGLDVSVHDCRCASFMCYFVERGVIVDCRNTPNPGYAAPLIADFLSQLDINVFLCHDMGDDDRAVFEALGIEVSTGASGRARAAVDAYVARLFSGDELADESLS